MTLSTRRAVASVTIAIVKSVKLALDAVFERHLKLGSDLRASSMKKAMAARGDRITEFNPFFAPYEHEDLERAYKFLCSDAKDSSGAGHQILGRRGVCIVFRAVCAPAQSKRCFI
jgi:hypothetical protein